MSWSTGYVTDVEYIFGYFAELHPGLLRVACLLAGLAPAPAGPLRYLELGYGQGVSLNIHAAALPGEFWGTDFSPGQATFARTMARASGADVTVLDDSFADLAARPDLPEFDVIVLHGIWTYVTDEDHRTIVDLVRRKLRLGGVLYMSYNCRPGWAQSEPLRDLLSLHARFASVGAASTANNVEGALRFCQQIADSGAIYFKVNPDASERLRKLAGQDRAYLAHEYFNRNWTLMTFAQVMAQLEPAKLTYVCSAGLLEEVEALTIPGEGRRLLAGIPHQVLRESVRDYMMNRQFRRDIYVKGPQRLTATERADLLKAQPFVLIRHPAEIPMTVTGMLGEAKVDEAIYRPVLEALAEDNHAPKTLGELHAHPRLQALPFAQLVQVMVVLLGAAHVFPAQSPTPEAQERCAALNRFLCDRARDDGEITWLVSPILGAGLPVTRMQQLFLRAIGRGRVSLEDQASDVWDTLTAAGQGFVESGRPLEKSQANMAELVRQIAEFRDRRLPILKALGVSL